jgi:hypothetical protein
VYFNILISLYNNYNFSLSIYFYIYKIIFRVVRLSSLGTAATTGLLYQPQMIDDGDCRAIGGMKIGRGNWSTRRKTVQAPLCPTQIPHDQTRARNRAAAVGRQQLTASAMARPLSVPYFTFYKKPTLKILVFSENVRSTHQMTLSWLWRPAWLTTSIVMNPKVILALMALRSYQLFINCAP